MIDTEILQKIPEWHNVTRNVFIKEILPSYRPAILRGIFFDWPLVQNGSKSVDDLFNYLLQFDQGNIVNTFVSPSSNEGHFFYNEGARSFNFQRINITFKECLARIYTCMTEQSPPAIYMGSTPADICLPGLMNNNSCSLVDSRVSPRLWMGNESLVQPHFDVSDNIAVVVTGRRRFTLFPPDQIDNLYIGPIDVTPAGQPMSMVSLVNPNLEKYPRYKIALAHAMSAELQPGDAIFIPSLWWHGVQALDKFNLLVNYWWNNSAQGSEDPYAALIHGVLTISSLPEKERHAWKHFFDHYVFKVNGHPLEHLPSDVHGVLGSMTPELYQLIRNYLYGRMKR